MTAVTTAPVSAVEVRSPGTWHRDIGVKRDEYLRSSAKELLARRHARQHGADALEPGPGEQRTGPLLPGFALAIDEPFA